MALLDINPQNMTDYRRAQQLGLIAPPAVNQPAPSPNLASRALGNVQQAGSGLLGGAQRVGSGLLGAGQAVGRAFAPELPNIAQNIADVARFTAMAEAQGPQLVTAADLSKLRPVSPASIAAQLPQLRAAEQEAIQKPMLDKMKAAADLARARGAGSRYGMKHPTKHVDKETGREFIALFDESLGKFVDPSTGNVVEGDKFELAESAGMRSKRMPSFGEMLKLSDKIQDDANAIRSIKRFRKSLSEREFGIKGKIDEVTSSVKTFFKGADVNLTPRQFYNRLSIADQQGLLGQIRESVVGGGVMTEFDAIRVLERMGGDVGSILRANPQVFGQATKDVMNDLYRKAERRIMFYNSGAKKYGDFDAIDLDALVSDVPDVSLGSPLTSGGNDPMGIR